MGNHMHVIQGGGKKPWADFSEFFTEEPTALTKAKDAQGHSGYMRLRLHPELHDALNSLVNSGKYPMYKSPGAFVRDAIVRGLMWLADESGDPEMQRRTKFLLAQLRIVERRAATQRAEAFLADLEADLERAKRERDDGTRKESLRDALEALPGIHPHYRQQLKDLIRKYK